MTTNNKGNTMNKETVENFIKRGGKIQFLPAQKANNKQIVYCKTSFTHGRIRMRHRQVLSGNGAYQLERKVA